METSINLDLDDLIGPEDDFEDDDLPAVTRLPALDEDDDQENLLNTSGQRNEGLLDTLLDPAGEGEGGEAPAAKRVVNRKPIPKLDATRLTGDRGLPVLMKQFENVKFKGKGHEVSDLDRLMRVMEHWAHRLFPKMPFDDVIERIEKLGSKKSVQTCMRRIRLDMPLLDEDFVTRGGEDIIEGGDAQPATIIGDDFPTPSFPGTQQPPSSINTPKVPMTDEQRECIERNKRLAMERKLNKQKEAQSSQMPAASQSGGLDEAELNDLFGTGGAAKRRGEDEDGIDSDEAEMEREMWESQMMEGKEEERGRKDEMKASQQRAAPEEMEIDPDEAEMEDEMWTQMTPSVATQSQRSQSQETPKLSTKSKVMDDESDDDDEMKSTKDSQGGKSQEEVPPRARRSKRVIEDDSDDDDDDVMEKMINSQMDAVQKVPSRGAKKRRVIDDDDDDDDDESDDEMEKEDFNKMTKLLSPRPPKDHPDELSAPRSQTVSQESKGSNNGEEKYVAKDGDDNEDPKNAEVDIDICNQMTEPVLSQKPADTLLISQETSMSSNLDKATNEDTEETGSEIWNQMTEQVATQNVNDSQEDMLYTALKSKKSVIDDDDDDEDDTQIDVDLCNQDTEPVATGDSQDTV